MKADVPGFNKYADHTLIWCSNQNSGFGCFGRDNPFVAGVENPKIILSVRGENLYSKAEKYRGPSWPPKDTAYITVYGIDGVCHQATNRFLYVADNHPTIPLPKSRGMWDLQGRPKGIFASYGLYGHYGHSFVAWLATYYIGNQRFIGHNFAKTIIAGRNSETFIKLSDYKRNNVDIADDFKENVNLIVDGIITDSFKKTHKEILALNQKYVTNFGYFDKNFALSKISKTDLIDLYDKINELSIEFQSQLYSSIGEEAYLYLNDDDSEYYNIIDSRIGVNQLEKNV